MAEAEMLAVAGLLVAAIAPAEPAPECPSEYPTPVVWTPFEASARRQCRSDGMAGDYTNKLHVTNTTQLTRDYLCQPANNDYPCCTAVGYADPADLDHGAIIECFANTIALRNARSMQTANVFNITCTDDVQTEAFPHDGFTIAVVTCPTAEPTTSGEAGDLDGATVGTIVVASLIGVALVGGAIAVHLQV